MIGTITAILNDSGISAEARYSNKIEADDSEWSTAVRVMTVHSAKGLEFPAVFLVGLDELKNPEQAKDVQEREQFERFARVNLVGPTRAKDLLFILASKENSYIRRVKEATSGLELHHWPEDYR
jgi:DNA helicase-2/ATP-dependent DNA helicase PcrA